MDDKKCTMVLVAFGWMDGWMDGNALFWWWGFYVGSMERREGVGCVCVGMDGWMDGSMLSRASRACFNEFYLAAAAGRKQT